MKTDESTSNKDNAAKKLLKFSCPHCSSERLEEVVLMRQDIAGVYDPEDPDYEWFYDVGGMVVVTRTVYKFPAEENYYRCFDCEVPLTDEDGYQFWGARELYKWLLANQVSEKASGERDCGETEQDE